MAHQKIEILTAQFVVIEYDLADIFERVIAALIDLLIAVISYLLFSWLLLTNLFPTLNPTIIILIGIFWYLIYLMGFEWYFGGQTIGKMLFKLRVVRSNGDFPDFKECMLRSLFTIIEGGLSGATLGVFMMLVTPRKQRLGDLAVDSVVIKTGNQFFYAERLNSLKDSNSFETTYPQVTQLKEEYILLLKEIIYNYKKYRLDTHRDLVVDAAKNTSQLLGIPYPQHPIQFLETVIKDYVISTR